MLPQPPLVARRSSSSYKHVRNNNLVSKSPFKSQIPTPSSTPSRHIPISFPSPRRVSGEKRPRPPSMHEQAENENERPFAFKRERRQSKGFQGLIEKEPVTKSPFKRTPSAEEEPPVPPLPLTHLLPKPTTSSLTHANAITSLAPSPSSIPMTGISPGRPSLVSRRMHGPRLSSGSRSKRQRRKTVTWDERCDVVEFDREEHETDDGEVFDGAEENDEEMGAEYEDQAEEDPFFRGNQAGGRLPTHGPDSLSESVEVTVDVSGDNDPSLLGMTLDPDASISGLVEEMFASSAAASSHHGASQHFHGTTATSTPPRHSEGSNLPQDFDAESGVSLRRSHHTTRFIQHPQSPKHSPQFSLYFSPRQSPQLSPHQLSSFNLPTHASPNGPPATPPRRSAPSPNLSGLRPLNDATERTSAPSSRVASPLPSTSFRPEVGPAHLSTPPLGRSTHAERRQLAKDDECDEDVMMLPGTPSPCKSARKSGSAAVNQAEGLLPRFGLEVASSSDVSSTSIEDPFSVTPLKDEWPPQSWEEGLTAEPLDAFTGLADDSQKSEDIRLHAMEDVEDPSSLKDDDFYQEEDLRWAGADPSLMSEEGQSGYNDMSHSSLPYAKSSPGAQSSSPRRDFDNCEQNLDISGSIGRRVNRNEVQRRLLESTLNRHTQSLNNSRSSTPVTDTHPLHREGSLSVEDVGADKDRMSVLTTMTDISTETAVIERAEKKMLTAANVVEGKEFGVLHAGERLQFDFGSKFGRGLDLSTVDYDSQKPSLDMLGAIGGPSKEKTPSIQSGSSSMKMGDVDVDMDMRSALDRLMDDVAGTQVDDSLLTDEGESYESINPPPSFSHSRPMERAAADSALLHNGFVSRDVSVSSASSSRPPPVPPKDNIRSRAQLILEKRREARRIEEGYSDDDGVASPKVDGRFGGQQHLGVGRPNRRRSMSTSDAEVLGGGAKKRGDIMLDVAGVGDAETQDDQLGDSIEKELKKLVEAPIRNQKVYFVRRDSFLDAHLSQQKYFIREHEGTIYASSSDPDVISHMAGPGDVNTGKAWRAVRRPSDMNEYSKQIKEYRAHEKSGKAYGKQPTALTCTLNNGIHFVSTPECQLDRDFRIEQEFELIEHSKLEFTLTLKIRRDSHIITEFKALAPTPVQAPAPPPVVQQTSSRGGMRSFFSSSPKKSSKDKLPAQAAPPPPQPAQRLPENLARYLKPDGTLARAFISFKDIASRCDTRLFETSYPLIGQRVEVGGKFSTLQVGEIVLQMFRLPPLPGIAPEKLPQSLEECHRGLRHINWHKVTYFEGILTQSGGDCSTWRRRQLRVIGANLVAFNDITKKATATIDLKQAIAVEDDQEARNNALSPASHARSSRYDEYDALYGVERSFRLIFPEDQEIIFFADTDEEKARWLDVLRALVGHIPPHPFWAELLWQRQEEQSRAAHPVRPQLAQPLPSWLVSRPPPR
ncbi:hypothetical protein DXG03_006262 [Asterophora parasitica]|uniref:PH domain-containing protein n=1 Tax=Asterophora parasitica TaxID=117018 RepID=A0A9P7GB14_9AGAR|nr:hypothetical protein DXG03_006262 [Asterophora parasitica]